MQNLDEIKRRILQEIKAAKKALLIAHQKPDGDTAGAALAMAHFLEDSGKEFAVFSKHELNPNLHFLPKAEIWQTDHQIIVKADYDLLIVLDSGDLQYAGIAEHVDRLNHQYTIINIDHHPTNTNYGHHNLINSDASSTCEIVYDLLNGAKALNKKIATCLLTGIVTDTNGFSNLATTSKAVETAGQLLLHGASLKDITLRTLQHRPINTLKLWGRALQRLTKDGKTGMILTAITQEDLIECNADNSATEGVANFLNSLEEAKNSTIAVLSQGEPGKIKVSLRTTSPLLDVSKFAKLMGGGGHKKAAGFTIKGTLKSTTYGWKII
ncbi:MAG: DHH family phosphoesterase [Patescibacteria group bacterium]|jgi:phosphoesterase RecJ-like protein